MNNLKETGMTEELYYNNDSEESLTEATFQHKTAKTVTIGSQSYYE
jgi:hypothetical protein